MDQWAPLAPQRLAPLVAKAVVAEKQQERAASDPDDTIPSVRGLSRALVLRILDHVPLADLPHVAMASRECRTLVNKEKLWKWRWDRLGWRTIVALRDPLLDTPPDPIPTPAQVQAAKQPPRQPAPTKQIDLLADLEWDTATMSPAALKPYSYRVHRAYTCLSPFLRSLVNTPSTTSSLLFTQCTSVQDQCSLVCILARFASEGVRGVPSPGLLDVGMIRAKLQQAALALHTQLRTAYTSDETRYKEDGAMDALASMKAHAALAWQLREVDQALGTAPTSAADVPLSFAYTTKLMQLGGDAVAQAYLASRPALHNRVPFNPHDVVGADGTFRARPLQAFVRHIEQVLTEECAMIDAVFPREQPVHLALLERIVHDLVADYVTVLLQEAREAPRETFLEAFAHSCGELQRVCNDVPALGSDAARAIVCSVWIAPMDEYVTAELAWQQSHLQHVCKRWLQELSNMVTASESDASMPAMAPHSAAEKRSFMANFKHALLRPAVSEQAAQSRPSTSSQDEWTGGYVGVGPAPVGFGDGDDDDDRAVEDGPTYATRMPERTFLSGPVSMSSLLNVETAVDMVNHTRVSLQRLDTLRKTPTELSARAQTACVQAIVQLYASLNDEHMTPGFQAAQEQIEAYDPAQHDQAGGRGDAADHVGPLLLFFELVHVGDTIQQMMQVFFERLDASVLGKADFTNAAVREKRRFESELDDHVAAGLSAGVELLVQQIEYIITVHQNPRDFYPENEVDADVSQPTGACIECCATMQTYCHMLATCADKALLDVFYQEIGVRLYGILCKHLKRQIISMYGGIRVISDLNHYFHFIESLKQPSLTMLFGALKRVATLFIVDEPKELAKLIQDTTLSNGTMRPEELYEFLRARCDFKTIESKVDAEMYGLKIREDCIIA